MIFVGSLIAIVVMVFLIKSFSMGEAAGYAEKMMGLTILTRGLYRVARFCSFWLWTAAAMCALGSFSPESSKLGLVIGGGFAFAFLMRAFTKYFGDPAYATSFDGGLHTAAKIVLSISWGICVALIVNYFFYRADSIFFEELELYSSIPFNAWAVGATAAVVLFIMISNRKLRIGAEDYNGGGRRKRELRQRLRENARSEAEYAQNYKAGTEKYKEGIEDIFEM